MKDKAKWIRNTTRSDAAPFFRKEFKINASTNPIIRICAAGYYELYINGKRVGDHVLDPVVSQYDCHIHYVDYDVKEYLTEGENCVGVILGNGWFDAQTENVWNLTNVAWRNSVRFYMELNDGTDTLLISDKSWKTAFGPITFNALRNGETYDARLEFGNWAECGFDDSAWEKVLHTNPPGGEMVPQLMPPCRVTKTYPYVKKTVIAPATVVFDFGISLAGWVRIKVKGTAGTSLTMRHGEHIRSNGELDQSNLAGLVESGAFQCDTYILKGGEEEIWEPRFTYHGFRYTQMSWTGDIEALSAEARFVHTDFPEGGTFSSSSEMLNSIQACTLQSYLSNFTGIPTDCPHREKNGWTGDAHIAAETGLCNFDSASSYAQWIETMADEQRPSGQVPYIVPCTGTTYQNDWAGPAWDSAYILIPWYMYLYRGDTSILKTHYEGFRRLVDYIDSMSEDNIADFGLWDWCQLEHPKHNSPIGLTSSGYFHICLSLCSKIAKILGKDSDVKEFAERAEDVRKAVNSMYYKGDGIYADGGMTSTACAVYQGLADECEKEKCVKHLVKVVEEKNAIADFGIMGAKYVPRVLADYGHIDLVYRMFTQEECPGWGNWIKRGATCLWEQWSGVCSQNHIMFGDISACMFNYFAGINPDENAPGFKHFFLKPMLPEKLEWIKAKYHAPDGIIRSDWEQKNGKAILTTEIPSGTEATLLIPGRQEKLKSGKYRFEWDIPGK